MHLCIIYGIHVTLTFDNLQQVCNRLAAALKQIRHRLETALQQACSKLIANLEHFSFFIISFFIISFFQVQQRCHNRLVERFSTNCRNFKMLQNSAGKQSVIWAAGTKSVEFANLVPTGINQLSSPVHITIDVVETGLPYAVINIRIVFAGLTSKSTSVFLHRSHYLVQVLRLALCLYSVSQRLNSSKLYPSGPMPPTYAVLSSSMMYNLSGKAAYAVFIVFAIVST